MTHNEWVGAGMPKIVASFCTTKTCMAGGRGAHRVEGSAHAADNQLGATP